MHTTRINKFIFQDGDLFLRLKTTATNLKVKKNNDSYEVEFDKASTKNRESFNVNLLESSDFAVLVKDEAAKLGYDKSEIEEGDYNVAKKKEKWGYFNLLLSKDGSQSCFYLQKWKTDCIVKVGPIKNEFEEEDLEIDWDKLQWNKSPETEENIIDE